MDGNGRWAREQGLSASEGHRMGVKAVKKIVRLSGELGLKVLTLYTFSKENWKRPPKEVSFLMNLLRDTVFNELNELMENRVRLMVSGDLDGMPLSQRKSLKYGMNKTRDNSGLVLNLALNYSGREEIVQAVKKICMEVKNGSRGIEEINEEVISSLLYTQGLPDPDLVIRTSGELRLSNFLLWQSSYSELYITPKYWPDFDELDFCEALMDYSNRERRFGGRT
ncbi:di-trans,poly-cis-decaprenylcistransferase [bacterium]|nr:di-trans,poly-cis-decaprenylcistransferase [bacterium]